MRIVFFCALIALSGCTAQSRKIVCPSLVEWPPAFQSQLAVELTAHPTADMPAFHELALRAEKQRVIVAACPK